MESSVCDGAREGIGCKSQQQVPSMRLVRVMEEAERPLAIVTLSTDCVWLVSSVFSEIRYTSLCGEERDFSVSVPPSRGGVRADVWGFWPLALSGALSPALVHVEDYKPGYYWTQEVFGRMVRLEVGLPESEWSSFEIETDAHRIPMRADGGLLGGFMLFDSDTKFMGTDGGLLWSQGTSHELLGPLWTGVPPWFALPIQAVLCVTKDGQPWVLRFVGGDEVVVRTPAAARFRDIGEDPVVVHEVDNDFRVLWIEGSARSEVDNVRLYSIDGELLGSAQVSGGWLLATSLLIRDSASDSQLPRYVLLGIDGVAVLSDTLDVIEHHHQPVPEALGLLGTAEACIYWWRRCVDGVEVWAYDF